MCVEARSKTQGDMTLAMREGKQMTDPGLPGVRALCAEAWRNEPLMAGLPIHARWLVRIRPIKAFAYPLMPRRLFTQQRRRFAVVLSRFNAGLPLCLVPRDSLRSDALPYD